MTNKSEIPWDHLFPPEAHTTIASLILISYVFLFIIAYSQLWNIFFKNYKLLSYYSVFLVLCILFSSLRIILAVFLLMPDCVPTGFTEIQKFLFFNLPVNLGLNLSRFSWKCIQACLGGSCFSLVVITSGTGFLVKKTKLDPRSSDYSLLFGIIFARLIFSDLLLIMSSVYLSYAMCKISQCEMSQTNRNFRHITRKTAVFGSTIITILNTFRAVHELIALFSHYPTSGQIKWISVNLEVDFEDLSSGYTLLQFLITLLMYEIIPYFIILSIFYIPLPDFSWIKLKLSKIKWQNLKHSRSNNETSPNPRMNGTDVNQNFMAISTDCLPSIQVEEPSNIRGQNPSEISDSLTESYYVQLANTAGSSGFLPYQIRLYAPNSNQQTAGEAALYPSGNKSSCSLSKQIGGIEPDSVQAFGFNIRPEQMQQWAQRHGVQQANQNENTIFCKTIKSDNAGSLSKTLSSRLDVGMNGFSNTSCDKSPNYGLNDNSLKPSQPESNNSKGYLSPWHT